MTIHLDYREPERRARLQTALLQIAVMCQSACLDDEGDRQKVAEAMTLGVLSFMNEEQIGALRARQVKLDALRESVASLSGVLTPEKERELMSMLTPEQREFFEKLYGSAVPSAEPNEGDAP